MGAYGLAVAAAFAVALAVLVSSTSNQTAEAATVDLLAADASINAAPGDTVNIVVASSFARVSITATDDGVGGSFASGGGQSVACTDDDPCDVDDDEPNTPGLQNVADSVTVALKVDADSGEGLILISIQTLGTDGTTFSKAVNVSKATLVGSLDIKADAASDKTIAADAGTSNLTVTVKNAASTPTGLVGQSVSITTTHGTVGCAVGPGATAGDTQACSALTDADGVVSVFLTGGGVEGQAVVTARLGTRTDTVTVTMFGTAKNLTAAPEQGSVEIGGSVFIVLTATDGAGNPVSGLQIAPVSSKEVVGPEGVDSPVLVTTTKNTPADEGDSPIGRGYSKDKIAPKAADNIPACGDDNTDTDTGTDDLQETFGPGDGTGDDGEGTNAKGQCVVEVTAPEDTADSTKSATRGVHTLNFQISATVKASATIEVAGKPASITTSADALGMVEPASVTEITVSVWDDEDVLVGITEVTVRKVGGDGLIEDQGEGNKEKTSNGQSKFTFIAPSTVGSSEILITAGKVNHRVTLQIGEEEPEVVEPPEPDEPSMPEGDATLSGNSGLVIFSGGSLDELEAAALAHCSGGAAIWLNDGAGSYVLFPAGAAIAAAQAPARAVYPDDIEGPAAVNITTCEQDAMEDEGRALTRSSLKAPAE